MTFAQLAQKKKKKKTTLAHLHLVTGRGNDVNTRRLIVFGKVEEHLMRGGDVAGFGLAQLLIF